MPKVADDVLTVILKLFKGNFGVARHVYKLQLYHNSHFFLPLYLQCLIERPEKVIIGLRDNERLLPDGCMYSKKTVSSEYIRWPYIKSCNARKPLRRQVIHDFRALFISTSKGSKE